MVNSGFRLNRLVFFLLGLVAYILVCFTLSATSAKLPQLSGFFIYFVAGVFLHKIRQDLVCRTLFFLPHTFSIVVALTANRGLFPDIVPLLIITCAVAFHLGSTSARSFQKGQLAKFGGLVLSSLLYLYITTQVLVPQIVFSRLVNEPEFDLTNYDSIRLVDRNGDSLTIDISDISVLDFWHTRCSSCYANNDYLNEQAKKYKNLGINYYLIYMGDIDSFKRFQETQAKWNWKNLNHLYDVNNRLTSYFRLEGAPQTLVISKKKVIYHQSGFSLESKSIEDSEMNAILMREMQNNSDFKNLVLGETQTIDVGESAHGSALLHLRFQNSTESAIDIENVNSSCNCIVSSWTKETIEKDEFGSISFTIPSGDMTNESTLVIGTTSSLFPFTVVKLTKKSIEGPL